MRSAFCALRMVFDAQGKRRHEFMRATMRSAAADLHRGASRIPAKAQHERALNEKALAYGRVSSAGQSAQRAQRGSQSAGARAW
jgi:hypothetical protein